MLLMHVIHNVMTVDMSCEFVCYVVVRNMLFTSVYEFVELWLHVIC